MKRNWVRKQRHHRLLNRKILALAIGSMAMGVAGGAWAQATTGTIRGNVPIAPGETIQISGGAGFNRSIRVGPSGKYSTIVPVGTYTVTLLQNGKPVQTRSDVSPVAAGAVTVNFASSVTTTNARTLSAVNVQAAAIPPIDVTTTNLVTTITAKQLQQLPLSRNAEAIALLAPTVNIGSPSLDGGPLGTPAVTFGGATTAENAYYIDGMLATNVLDDQGGVGLPYNSIAEQQTFISGYGAKYGRSIGGVINQIGRSGTNEWHYGFHAQWEPTHWHSVSKNYYFANPYETVKGEQPGDMNIYAQGNRGMQTIYDAYVGGPIVKNKLLFFLSAEQDRSRGVGIGATSDPIETSSITHAPKLYLKLNWNINATNSLAVTALQSSLKGWSDNYLYSYETHSPTAFFSTNRTSKNTYRMWVANYTSEISNNLTLHAMIGKSREEYYNFQPAYPGFNPSLPFISNAFQQNPALVPTGGIINSQTSTTSGRPDHQVTAMSYRINLRYKWGNNVFQLGIDNDQTADVHDGSEPTGPGYWWSYGVTNAPNVAILGISGTAPYVGPTDSNTAGAGGYYVEKVVSEGDSTMNVHERAQYIQDNWQVTPKLLLKLGVRNDQFINYNAVGVPYIRLTKPQWSPRLGFSWDVHGDSTLKVFGNAGRYYLTLPSGTGESISAAITNTALYGTYTGVDSNGEPTGFKPLPQIPSTGVSLSDQYGQGKPAQLVAPEHAKAPYSDNFVLGAQQQLHMLGSSNWVFGVVGTYEKLDRILGGDDNVQSECDAGVQQGLSYMSTDCAKWTNAPFLVNPGINNKMFVLGPDGNYHIINLTAANQGFQHGPKRRYYSLDLSLTHVWNGKWFGRVDYVFSRLYGNESGPVNATYGASGTDAYLDETWAFQHIADYAYGVLPANHTSVFKLYGAYAISPEWMVGANINFTSGAPKGCLSAYGPDQILLGGSYSYHWCGGKLAVPGTLGYMPWVKTVDVNVNYSPAFADHKLKFELSVFNLFNSQVPTLLSPFLVSTFDPNPYFDSVQARQGPRFARFSVSYNF